MIFISAFTGGCAGLSVISPASGTCKPRPDNVKKAIQQPDAHPATAEPTGGEAQKSAADDSNDRLKAASALKSAQFQRESAPGPVDTTGILFADKENKPFMKGVYSSGTRLE
ncbi:hypothetical protein [Desulfovibrio sp. 3_1_syn3]|uniref:hypothetical protein n=1 Tax=Desulfovibrio sp. 3_1_syn3 TaxID=457398 RepID=UPI0011C8B135|nr:hypothetical protein [Desulfovibrio sp. 3_1_syn3]